MILEKVSCEFKINVVTVSNLLQIEPNQSNDKDKNTKASIVRTKKKKFVAEDGSLDSVPFYSANGLRGMNRRRIASVIFSTLEQKDGKKINPDTAHLYASGGGTSNSGIESLNYFQKETVRAANPFLSVFGAGLSDIDGKLSVTDLTPKVKGKSMIDFLYGVRFDETKRSSILSPLLDKASVEKYLEEQKATRSANAAIRGLEDAVKKLKDAIANSGDKDTSALEEELFEKDSALTAILDEKGMSYQQVYKAEFIIPGTELTSCIGTRAGYELTELERGMMLYGLILSSQHNIGSYSRIGWGAMDWSVKDGNDNLLFKTICDDNYNLEKRTEITDAAKAILKPFEEWLENLKREDIVTL